MCEELKDIDHMFAYVEAAAGTSACDVEDLVGCSDKQKDYIGKWKDGKSLADYGSIMHLTLKMPRSGGRAGTGRRARRRRSPRRAPPGTWSCRRPRRRPRRARPARPPRPSTPWRASWRPRSNNWSLVSSMSSTMAFRRATGAAEAAVAEPRSVDAASSSTTARRIEHRRGQRLHESRPEVCNRGSTTLCE